MKCKHTSCMNESQSQNINKLDLKPVIQNIVHSNPLNYMELNYILASKVNQPAYYIYIQVNDKKAIKMVTRKFKLSYNK